MLVSAPPLTTRHPHHTPKLSKFWLRHSPPIPTPFPYTTLFRSRAPRMGIQLVRLRSQEREIDRELLEHTPERDPGGVIMNGHTLAVQINMLNSRMVRGGPPVKSLLPHTNTQNLGKLGGK